MSNAPANTNRANTYIAIGIIVVGLTGFFQAANVIRTYVQGETGTDIRRQIEPTQTADITKIQTDISAINTSIHDIKQNLKELRQWQVEELRAISELRARTLNLEQKKPK